MIALKKYLKYILLSVAILTVGKVSFSQQLPLYSQYLNNGFLLNPAMTGYDGYTSLNMTVRKQWAGFKNSPLTYSFSAQTRLLRKSYNIINRNGRSNRLKSSTKGRVGLGGFIFNDINGLVSRTGVQFSYAYHIYMYRSQLSFGLAGQAFQYKIDRDNLSFFREDDPLIQGGLNTVTFIPDANFGVFWTGREFFLGFSANQLFQSILKLGSSDLGNLKMYRHYYLMGGYRFINPTSGFDLEPSVMLKTTEQLLPQADFTLKTYYRNDYWIGVSYRTSGAVSAMFGIRSDKLFLGYAYEYSLSRIRKYNFGSHEVLLSLKLGSNARRFRWLNRY